MKKICIITCNRADWSKLQPVACKLATHAAREVIGLEVVALGSHMLHELGDTKKAVLAEFPNAHVLHTLVAGDCAESMTDSVGFGVVKVSSLLTKIRPDLLLMHF